MPYHAIPMVATLGANASLQPFRFSNQPVSYIVGNNANHRITSGVWIINAPSPQGKRILSLMRLYCQ